MQRARDLGIEPTHIDTHIGTVYTRPDFLRAYLRVSVENGIPAMTMQDVEGTVDCLVEDDFPLREQIVDLLAKGIGKKLEDYPFPRLDVLCSVRRGDTYEEVREGFFDLVRSLEPGIAQIFIHPAVDSPGFRKITNSWQHRVWESQLFADPEVKQFFADEGILFTSWREMMSRFEGSP
ncbi:MAG: ChbG/HpnK family deacetylase [bacterium]|nr:ChbG/HpnK family deacetylase [bacterium]